jgi:hypothetical protein
LGIGRLTTLATLLSTLAAIPAGHARSLGMDPLHAAVVERAVEGARRRLQAEECRRIFTDFEDAAGAPLQRRLDTLRLDGAAWLGQIVFTEGFGQRACRRGQVLALTMPGSRVVYVCGARLRAAQARRSADAEVVVLHEALHTLGLGENPPDSLEITRRVSARCVPER